MQALCGQTELLADCLDDPRVGLVGDHPVDVGDLDAEGRRGVGELGEDVTRGVVLELVDRIEPQRVDVEVTEPPQRVLDEEVRRGSEALLASLSSASQEPPGSCR